MTQTLAVSAGAALTCSLNQTALEASPTTWTADGADIHFEGAAFQPGMAIGTALAVVQTGGGSVTTRSWTEEVELVAPPDN